MSDVQTLTNQIDELTRKIQGLQAKAGDGWKNILTGLYGKMDKSRYTTFGNSSVGR